MNVEEFTMDTTDNDMEDKDKQHDVTLRPTEEEQLADKEMDESGGAGLEGRPVANEIERIVEHDRVSEMAAKFKEDAMFKDHWQIRDGLLERYYTPETVLYRIRWRGFGEIDDTFQPESTIRHPLITLRGDPVFEDYVKQQNLCDPSRCLMPTDETMKLVRYNLRRGRLTVENYGPLKAAANDINTCYPGGEHADKALQASYESSQARVKSKQTKKLPEWRLVYMLLDAGVLCPTAANSNLGPFVVFEQALFYIGKGTVQRPFRHLEEARDYLLKADSQHKQLSDCAQRVADIWRDGYGVIVPPVITKLYDDDAKGREAALISLKTIGLSNLVNAARGNFPPLDNVTPKDWEELGVMELIKAYKLYKRIEAKCCYLWDIPSQIEDIELWYGVCPTPYRSEVTFDEPSTSTSHIPSATGRPEGSGNLPTSLPPANAKEWHASITQDLRHHMVGKLVKAVFPSPALATLPDAKAKHLVSYARKAEKEMFEVADDKEEYYHLLAVKIYKIEKELQARKDKRLSESQ